MEHKAYKVVYIKEILLNYYCNYLSLSSNLIYGIHCSYYSILISMCIENSPFQIIIIILKKNDENNTNHIKKHI